MSIQTAFILMLALPGQGTAASTAQSVFAWTFRGLSLHDCNSNGLPDAVDIANGSSPDCNDNGIPDECDVARLRTPPAALLSPDAGDSDAFGLSVGLQGDIAVVGAMLDACSDGHGCGTAYVFRFDGTDWSLETELTASDATGSAWFGGSVAIDSDVVLTGAPGAACAAGHACGAAYVFRSVGDTWVEEAVLEPSDSKRLGQFGHSVKLNGNLAAVGLPDGSWPSQSAVYLFRFDGSKWTEERKLISSSHRAGYVIALAHDVCLVRSIGADCDAGAHCGAVAVFRNVDGDWIEEALLVPEHREAYQSFGVSAALSGDLALIGASGENCLNGTFCGAVYEFEYENGQWTEKSKLVAADAGSGDNFGFSIAAKNNIAVIGSWGNDCLESAYCGGAYVFHRTGLTWTQTAKLSVRESDFTNDFGISVAMDTNRALIGACWDEGIIPEVCGSAYVFDIPSPDCDSNGVPDECDPDFDGDGNIDTCDPDIDNDGVPNESDVCNFTPLGAPVQPDGGLRADLDGDCDVDLIDFAIMQFEFTGPG